MSATQQFTLNLNSRDEPLGLALRRACDRCRKRKSRCDGQKTCKSCSRAGADCSYLIEPKPLGRRPRKQRAVKCPPTQAQPFVAQTPDPTAGEQISFGDSLETVVSAITPNSDGPQPLFEDVLGLPDDLPPQPLGMGLPTLDHWCYPPLSLYSPSLDGGLPFDAGSSVPTLEDDSQHINALFTPHTTEPLASSSINGPSVEFDWRLPVSTFIPYINLFFERLYPVFPVLDRESLPSEAATASTSQTSWDQYALHTSLAAAVTVQLNVVGTSPVDSTGEQEWSCAGYDLIEKSGQIFSADFWVHQTLQSRAQWDFMSSPSEATIMTSFFLFEYYGNKNQAQRAWYYLREAIGFALAIGLDDQDTYENLAPRVAQRLCRLFWLLFVTERAYALQHKSSAILRSSIDLPRIFESDNPKLIYGFASLVNLFKSVDDKFLSLWKGRGTTPTESKQSWQRAFSATLADQGVNSVHEIMEIQRLDIMVTQQWLHLLAWQIQSRRRQRELTQGTTSEEGDMVANRSFPFSASRHTLQIVTTANRRALESHGIGMEQKIFDIACCLSDTLQFSSKFDQRIVSVGHQYLHGFMTVLSSFRNQESQYLQPLLAKASKTLAAELSVPASLPEPVPVERASHHSDEGLIDDEGFVETSVEHIA